MRKKKIAMFLAMALTLTQSVGMTVPVAAEELEIDAGQEEVFQDDSDAETTVDAVSYTHLRRNQRRSADVSGIHDKDHDNNCCNRKPQRSGSGDYTDK